jgi:hypothetical protein
MWDKIPQFPLQKIKILVPCYISDQKLNRWNRDFILSMLGSNVNVPCIYAFSKIFKIFRITYAAALKKANYLWNISGFGKEFL